MLIKLETVSEKHQNPFCIFSVYQRSKSANESEKEKEDLHRHPKLI